MDLENFFGAQIAYGLNHMVKASSIPTECAFAGLWFSCYSSYEGSGLCSWVWCSIDYDCPTSFMCETYFYCDGYHGGPGFECLSIFCDSSAPC